MKKLWLVAVCLVALSGSAWASGLPGGPEARGEAFRRLHEATQREPVRVAMFMGAGVTATPSGLSCPSSYADGCAGAPAAGSYQITAAQFATYAQLNGLTFDAGLGNHPQPWNVAGIDYKLGYDKSGFNPAGYDITASPLGLKDASKSANWAKDGLTNCSVNTSTHIVTCGVVASPTIQYYDFQNTAAGCMRLIFNGNASGDVLIKNNNFKNADGSTLTTSSCNAANNALITMSSNALATSVTITQNEIDGNGANLPDKIPQVVNITSSALAPFTFTYNTCKHLPARCGTVNTGGAKTITNNMFLGMTYPPNGTYPAATFPNTNGIHGEIFENSTGGIGNAATAIEHEDYNTILLTDENGTSGNRNTAAIYLSDGGATSALWSLFTANNNTIVLPPSDGVNANTVTLISGGSGYVNGDTIYDTPVGCGNLGPAVYVIANSGGVITSLGNGPVANTSSGNGHCFAVPTNPVAQNTTTGTGTGATFNFSNWTQQTASFAIVGESRELQSVEIKNNYVGVTNAGSIVTSTTPGCWSFASGAPSPYVSTGNVNWKANTPVSSTIITGTNPC